MEVFLLLLTAALAISLTSNVFLYLRWKKAQKAPTRSIELQEFLSDLLGGGFGMVAVGRIDPTNLLLRSPKR